MADETIEMEVEFGVGGDSIVHADNGKVGGGDNVPKGRSIAHHLFHNQQAVFMSFEIKTAGEIAGIVQISAEIVCLKMNADGRMKVGSDHADDVERIGDMFNSYMNPEVHQEYWDQRSISVHGILPDDNRIMNANCVCCAILGICLHTRFTAGTRIRRQMALQLMFAIGW